MAKLDTQITIQRPVEKVESGNVTTTWKTFKTVWCNYQLRNRDYYADGVYIEQRNATFYLWQDDTIELNQRIVFNKTNYEITDISPSKIRNRMEIKARKV